ncbi:MAG: F0F1 ATP synthase subunit delta [Gammaproteobacteria bacterium]
MAEKSTVARPYAKAVFELAREGDSMAAWSELLTVAAEVVKDPGFSDLLGSPLVEDQKLADLVIEVCGERADQLGRNLIRVLAENDRLAYLPEIDMEFEQLRAEAERIVDVQVTSSIALGEAQQQKIAAAMGKRLGKNVRLHCEIDESLLGGAVVRAGDLVIDGSLRGRLERLAGALTH